MSFSREDSHPRAREVLSDAFFWDASDPCGPFGNETGLDVLKAVDERDDDDPAGLIALLQTMLARWEVVDDHWDVIDEDDVQAIGADDETSLLTRDEAIIALAFAQIVVEGRLDAEVRRRAMVALARQSLPALLHGWGDRRLARADRIERMRAVLARRWS
jgi:uncharacterized protein YfeS